MTWGRRIAWRTKSSSCIAVVWWNAAMPHPSFQNLELRLQALSSKAGSIGEPNSSRMFQKGDLVMNLTRRRWIASFGILIVALMLSASPKVASAADRFITVASTTSTQDSGLFDYLLPIFTAKTGIEVRVVAKGTGEAIKLAQAGDADVLFVHHKPSEEKFVSDGFGVKRYQL